jgi:hypothetical protein
MSAAVAQLPSGNAVEAILADPRCDRFHLRDLSLTSPTQPDRTTETLHNPAAKVYSRYEVLNRVSMHRAWSMRVEIAVKSVITAAVTSTPPSGLRAVCPLAALFLPLAG